MARTLLTCVVCVMAGVGGLASENAPLESDPISLDSESYRLCTDAQALIWNQGDYPDFIDWPDVPMAPALQKSVASLKAAERATELDRQNPYAHALLARYYLLPLDTDDLALESWTVLFDNGLGVSLTASYAGAPVIGHIKRDGIYVYRYEQFGVHGDTPSPSQRAFWDANAGNIPSALEPSVVLSWEDVEAIVTTEEGWKLEHHGGGSSSIAFSSGIDSFGWDLDWYDFWFGDVDTREASFLPLDYHARLRTVVLGLIDPEGRIRAP